jgi:hypothetical protein
MKRVLFTDIKEDDLELLKEVYFPIFDKMSDMTFKEAYETVKEISRLSESGTRCAMKNLYDIRELSIDESNMALKQKSFQFEVHKHRREKLSFNALVRDKFDELMLLETYSEKLHSLNIKPFPNVEGYYETGVIPRIMLADLHIGKYEQEEHKELLNQVLNKMLNNINVGSHIDLVFVGDIIDGILRMSQLVKVKADITRQVIWANELLLGFFESVSEYYTINAIYFIDEDNHSEIRPLASQRGDFPEMNMLKIVSQQLGVYCKMKNISYHAGSELVIDISGEEYIIEHGDKKGGKNAIHKYHKDNNVIYAHYHNYESVYNECLQHHLCLGALCLGDDYTNRLGIRHTYAGFVIETNGFFKMVKIRES